ncbi:MAG: hypothetical protein LQ338_002534 [Usnochroma carphineum]|nr:MAG: hypothetical protein LQ338_002534 [Usnochroma carphineum]
MRQGRFRSLLASTIRPLAYLGLATVVLSTLLFDDEEDAADELREEGTSEESNEDDTIFIPLGFAYKLPQRYYKGTDPEWQSFIQLSQNKKLCEFLKNELTGLVGQYVGPMPPFQKALGENNKPRKFWIDIDFPQGPPPEYERKGLEIGVDHISWTARSVHPLHYSKLQKALWPESLASSAWASQKTFVFLQYAKIKNVLAFSSSSEASSSKESKSPSLRLQNISQQTGSKEQEPDRKSDRDLPANSPTFNQTSDQPPTENGSTNVSKWLPVTPTIPNLGNDIVSAGEAFKKTFAKTWRPAHVPPERGTVMFSGMVELVGPKGVAVLDVHAAYHAAESRWSQIAIAPRRVQPRKQSPRGGP